MASTRRSASPGAVPRTVRTRRGILDLLKRQGPKSAEAMAKALHVTAMAVRQHLYELQAQRLVDFDTQPGAVGRPAKRWRLTPKADRYFPDAHAELTVGLIGAVKEALGAEGMDKILQQRNRQVLDAYRQEMLDTDSLPRRLRALAKLRTRDGYMAGVEKLDGDALLLVENHCPICAAAEACQGLCAGELEVFRKLMGPNVKVERTDHIQAGARRCAYRIEPKSSAGRGA